MSEVIEPVHMGPAVVKGMYELMRDYSVHVGLLVDVVLTQNDLGEKTPTQIRSVLIGPHGLQHLCSCVSYLRRGRVKSAADRPVTVLTGKVPIFKHFTASREEKWKHCDALYFVKLCFGIFVTLTCLRANKL